MTQVFDLEKCSISKKLLQVSSEKMTLFYAIMVSDTLISARPLRGSPNPRLSGLGFNTILVF